MLRLLKIHFIFLIVALVIAFILVPLDLMYFEKVPTEEINYYYQSAIMLEQSKAWKIVFTWFLGLSCGRLMIKALMK